MHSSFPTQFDLWIFGTMAFRYKYHLHSKTTLVGRCLSRNHYEISSLWWKSLLCKIITSNADSVKFTVPRLFTKTTQANKTTACNLIKRTILSSFCTIYSKLFYFDLRIIYFYIYSSKKSSESYSEVRPLEKRLYVMWVRN